MKKIFSLLLLIFIFFGIVPHSLAGIDLTVSPIKYEIDVLPGVTITKTAKIINNTPNDYNIITGKSDFTTSGKSGLPRFVRQSELVFPDQQLSEWIQLSTPNFFLPAKTEKEITFSIEIPASATPGGHYGAVFFKNNNIGGGNGGQIGLNVDYGVLILINVAGEIVTEGEINDIVVSNSRSMGTFKVKTDDCFLDFTQSNFDGICLELPFDISFGEKKPTPIKKPENPQDIATEVPVNNQNNEGQQDTLEPDNIQQNNNQDTIRQNNNQDNPPLTQNTNTNNNDKNSNSNDENGEIEEELDLTSADDRSGVEFVDIITTFGISFKNVGNTHLKPTGKITLVDEEGRQIKKIGKKIIKNEAGVIMGEEVIDYLPINDVGGNVLPYSERIFTTDWKGFPYKGYDEEGNPTVKYWSPSEYYTNQNMKENPVILPWERILQRYNTKKLTANIEVSYTDKNGEEIVFNSAREILVSYQEEYIGLNYNIVVPAGVLGFFFFLFLLFRRKKTTKCIECKKKIEKDMKICPYCETRQHKNSHKDKKNKKKS